MRFWRDRKKKDEYVPPPEAIERIAKRAALQGEQDRRKRISRWLWRLIWWPQFTVAFTVLMADAALGLWVLFELSESLEALNFWKIQIVNEVVAFGIGAVIVVPFWWIVGKYGDKREEKTRIWLTNKMNDKWGKGWDYWSTVWD